MVRLFQTELEHYEKIEGSTLSMDGKANRLAALVRGNLGMAMQGLAVVPLFAGFDHDTDGGRIFSYDVTGGRYEETAFHSVGSGSLFARGSLKKLYRDDLTPSDASGRRQALYDAADDDSATGGPDLTRRIFPVVQVMTADGGYRMPDAEVAAIADRVIAGRMSRPDGPAAPLDGGGHAMSMPFYVSPEQLMKDRADFARKGIARGRSVVAVQYADGILFVVREPVAGAAQGLGDLRPDRVRRGRPLQRVREPAHRRRPPRRHARLRLRPPRRHRPRPRQRLRADARHDLLQRWREAVRGGALRRRDRRRRGRRPALPADVRRPGRRRARLRRDGRRGRRRRAAPQGALRRGRIPRRRAPASPSPRWDTPRPRTGSSPPTTSRWRCSTAPARSPASSSGCAPRGSTSCSASAAPPYTRPSPRRRPVTRPTRSTAPCDVAATHDRRATGRTARLIETSALRGPGRMAVCQC